MTEKYIDLADRVARETETHGLYVSRVLQWLDEHPNPTVEPTNAEKLEIKLREACEANADQEFGRFAKWLDEAGVKAPGGDDAESREASKARSDAGWDLFRDRQGGA